MSEEINMNYQKGHHHINTWDPVHFTRLLSSVGFTFKSYHTEGIIPLPVIMNKKLSLKSNLFFLKNLSYRMIFTFVKTKESNIQIFE